MPVESRPNQGDLNSFTFAIRFDPEINPDEIKPLTSQRTVYVATDIEGWVPIEMSPLKSGSWTVTLTTKAKPTKAVYVFKIEDGNAVSWTHDTSNDQTAPNGFGGLNSVHSFNSQS